jgi:hypothetical protein
VGQSAYGQPGYGQPGYGQNPPNPDYRQDRPGQDRTPPPGYGTQWQPPAPPPAAQTRVDLGAIRTDQEGAGRPSPVQGSPVQGSPIQGGPAPGGPAQGGAGQGGLAPAGSTPAGQGQDETRLDLGGSRADLTRTDLTTADFTPPSARPEPSPEPETRIDELRALRDDRPAAPAATPAEPGETAVGESARGGSPRENSARAEAAGGAGIAYGTPAGTDSAVRADDAASTASATADVRTTGVSGTGVSGTGVSGKAGEAEDLRQTMGVPQVPADDVAAGAGDGESTAKAAETGHRMVTVVPGVPRYHAANCILIRFMEEDDLQKMSLSEATEAGCSACRACQGDTGAFRTLE